MAAAEGRYLLLYVEDDPDARGLVQRAIALKFRQVTLLTAENGAIGLQMFREHRPDVVLTDIRMPVLDGIAMAAQIRQLRPDAVIAVISAYCDTQQYLVSVAQLGIDHCVLKPIDYRDLFVTIEKCLDQVATVGNG